MSTIQELIAAIKKLEKDGKYFGGFYDSSNSIMAASEKLTTDEYLIKGELSTDAWPFKPYGESITIDQVYSSPTMKYSNGDESFGIALYSIMEVWALDEKNNASKLLYSRGSMFENDREYDLIKIKPNE